MQNCLLAQPENSLRLFNTSQLQEGFIRIQAGRDMGASPSTLSSPPKIVQVPRQLQNPYPIVPFTSSSSSSSNIGSNSNNGGGGVNFNVNVTATPLPPQMNYPIPAPVQGLNVNLGNLGAANPAYVLQNANLAAAYQNRYHLMQANTQQQQQPYQRDYQTEQYSKHSTSLKRSHSGTSLAENSPPAKEKKTHKAPAPPPPPPADDEEDFDGNEDLLIHGNATLNETLYQVVAQDGVEDGYRWRKYGQKVMKGSPFPRSYYKCTMSGCTAKKLVESVMKDGKEVTVASYRGSHNHPPPSKRSIGKKPEVA